MNRSDFFHKAIDYSYSPICEAKRIIEVLSNKTFNKKIDKIIENPVEYPKWMQEEKEIVSDEEYLGTYVNGIKIKFYIEESFSIPILYCSDRYTFKEGKISPDMKAFFDKDLEMIVIINKFNDEYLVVKE